MQLKDRKVLVLGLGDTGLSMARWLARHGARVHVADTRANLIIATVQHARGVRSEPTPARGWAVPISLGALLQATILVAAAFLLRP